jgi:crossover junction endodeoxyribonuclease RuvC
MRALGIDPGTGRCGFGIVDKIGNRLEAVDYGVIETFPDMPDIERLSIVHQGVSELIEAYRPDVMGVETLYFNRNITTAIAVAQARGVILLAGFHAHVPVFDCTPLQVKQQVVGYGRAEKRQVTEMTMRMLSITEKINPDDAADALAIGLTTIYRMEHEERFRR